MNNQFSPLLISLGLSSDEATIYEYLANHAGIPAKALVANTHLSRPTVYRVIESLTERGLVETDESRKVSHFRITHPDNLNNLIDRIRTQATQLESALQSSKSALSSLYNLTVGKPGVRFFEGLSGIEAVLEDTLNTEDTIYMYADPASIFKHFGDLNARYVAKRDRYGIKKRVIMPSSTENIAAMDNYHSDVTEARLAPLSIAILDSTLQIYDNKISYINHSGTHLIGVIIEDATITTLHRALFEMTWNQLSQTQIPRTIDPLP